jgi:hypothetical protein
MSLENSSTEPWGLQPLCIAAVLTARKADFLSQALGRIDKLMTQRAVGANARANVLRLEEQLPLIVASLDPNLFVTKTESSQHALNLGTTLDGLDRSAIWEAINTSLEDTPAQHGEVRS